MASYVSIIALCFLVASINCHVIRPNQFRVPAQGMTLEILIKPTADRSAVVEVKEVAIENKTLKEGVKAALEKTARTTTVLPKIEKRLGILVGNCPTGYAARGGFCFPDYD